MKITFLGAVEEVTGSRYLVEHQNLKILVDCGLFQGIDSVHNQAVFPVDPTTIDAIIITHAHIDHTGYIPALVKKGFKGKIYCTQATYDICAVVLPDSGAVQEDDVKKAQNPAVIPLYTELDAQRSLRFFHVVAYDTNVSLGQSLEFTLIFSGHILGSSFVVISNGAKKITFSGDLGGFGQLVIKSPTLLHQTDYLVIESTYGNRVHEHADAIKVLGDVVHQAIQKGGVIVIPAFAVGRAQTILYCLYQLRQKQQISNIPIFLDSPMAIRISQLLCHFAEQLRVNFAECTAMLDIASYTHTSHDSKVIERTKPPMIIIAGSGMAEGGRVVQHLKEFISDAKNTIIFVGFQAEGTHGYDLVHGAKQLKIEGATYNVHAEIKNIDLFSAHADYQEILEWLGYFQSAPTQVFVTHGTKESAVSLQDKIVQRFGWSVVVPKYLESFDLN